VPLFWGRLVASEGKCVARRRRIPILPPLRPQNKAPKELQVTIFNRLLFNGILAIAALGLTQCADTDEPTNTGSDTAVAASDVASSTDAVTVSDAAVEVDAGTPGDAATTPDDTASPVDATVPADTTTVSDVSTVEDVAPEADVVPMDDVAVEEDVAPMEDVMPAVDTAPAVPDGACTNPEDQAIVDSVDVEKIAEECAKQNIFSPDNSKKCIKEQTDLSDPCVDCFGGISECVMASCLASGCLDPESEACLKCVNEKCLPKFEDCSGLSAEVPEG
jgi:hypothetical protein